MWGGIQARIRVTGGSPNLILGGLFSILENSVAGTIVGGLSVTNTVDTWTFSITDTAGSRFALSGSNLVAGAVATNYEAATSHSINLRAVNNVTGQTITRTFVISVLNLTEIVTAMTVTWLTGFTSGNVPESTAAGGGLTTRLATLLPDLASVVTLPVDGNGFFGIEIDSVDDTIYLVLKEHLNFTAVPSYALTARATADDGSFDKAITVTVVEVARPPVDILVTGRAGFVGLIGAERTQIGTVLADITATPGKVGDTHTFEIFSDPDNKFDITNLTELVLDGTVHFSTLNQHSFTVRATNNHSLTLDKTFTFRPTTTGTFNSLTDDLVARFTTPPTAARKLNIDRLMHRLRYSAWYDDLDFFFSAMAADQPAANQEWLFDLGELSPQASCTWTADLGYTGNGTTMYVSLGIDPLALGTLRMLQDNIILGVVCLTDSVSNTQYDVGCANNRGRVRGRSGSIIAGSVSATGLTSLSSLGGVPPSNVAVVRTASNVQNLWRNGEMVQAGSAASAGLPNALELLRTGTTNFSDRQVACVYGGRVPTTFLDSKMRSLNNSIVEFITAIANEGIIIPPPTLPDVDLTATSLDSLITYTRAGSVPYINATGDWATAGANTWPVDHSPVSPYASRGRRIIPADVRTRFGPHRTFSGFTVTGTGVTMAADTGYTSYFGDTLGGLLSEGSGGAASRNAISAAFAVDPKLPSRVIAVVDPVTLTSRQLRLRGQAASTYYYADFDLTAGGTVARLGVSGGSAKVYGAKIELGKNGFYIIQVWGKAGTAGTTSKIGLDFVDTAGSASVTGTGNTVRVDNLDMFPSVNEPPIFGTLAGPLSAETPKIGNGGLTNGSLYDMGLTDETGVEWYPRDVTPSSGSITHSWPLEATVGDPAVVNLDLNSRYTTPVIKQWMKRWRVANAPDFENLVNPPGAALVGKITEQKLVPSASPFTVTLAQTPGAVETVTVTGLTRVASAPAAGQFSVSGAVLTFNTAQGGKMQAITYWNAQGYMALIAPTGGGAATPQVISTKLNNGSGFGDALRAANNATPRVITISPSLTGVLDHQGTAQVEGSNLTVNGHENIITGRGNVDRVGTGKMASGTPFNIIHRNRIIWPGDAPIAKPVNYKAAYAGPVQVPLTGSTGSYTVGEVVKQIAPNGTFAQGWVQSKSGVNPNVILTVIAYHLSGNGDGVFINSSINPIVGQTSGATGGITGFSQGVGTGPTPYGCPTPAEGFGYQWDDRDGLQVWQGFNILLINCLVMGSIDELGGMFVHGNGLQGGIESVKNKWCIFAQALQNPQDNFGRWVRQELETHNYGILMGSQGLDEANEKCRNLVIDQCIFAGLKARNPVVANVNGAFIKNNLVYDWQQYGTASSTKAITWGDSRTSFEDNLYIPGPDTDAEALKRAIIMMASEDEPIGYSFPEALCVNDNFLTDGINFNSDTEIDWNTVYFQQGHDPRGLRRERPFYSADPPEFDCSTAAGRQALYNRLLSPTTGLCGPRVHSGTTPQPGDTNAGYQTKRVLNLIRARAGMIVHNNAEMGGQVTS